MTSPTAPASTLRYRARQVRRRSAEEGVRRVRVVHDLDGIERLVQPQELVTAGEELWRRWQAHPGFVPPTMILGLDAGGIIPAIAVALASGTPYRLAWKLDLDLPDKHVFREPHARRPEVWVYGALEAERILVVDDEVTTGQTLGNLVDLLHDIGAQVVGVACLVEDTSGDSRTLLTELGIPLCALTTL